MANDKRMKTKKVIPKKKAIPRRKQTHVEGVQANVESSAKESARAKRLAKKAAVDLEQSQIIEGIDDDLEENGCNDNSKEPRQIGEEVTELRLMLEGLTSRLVETQSILSSFTMKVDMLLRGRESGSDVECTIEEDKSPAGIAESTLTKNDCIFMRNLNITGSNLLVSLFFYQKIYKN